MKKFSSYSTADWIYNSHDGCVQFGRASSWFWSRACSLTDTTNWVIEQSHHVKTSQFRVCILWRTWSLWSLWSVTASPSETLLTWSAVVKWDGLAFGAFPGCVTRCFTLTFFFSCVQRILGNVRPVHPPEMEKKEPLEDPSDWDRLQMLLWRMQTWTETQQVSFNGLNGCLIFWGNF